MPVSAKKYEVPSATGTGNNKHQQHQQQQYNHETTRSITDVEREAIKELCDRLGLSKAQFKFNNVPIFFMTIQMELSQLIEKV